jgi:hypothetical protein
MPAVEDETDVRRTFITGLHALQQEGEEQGQQEEDTSDERVRRFTYI